MKIKKSTAILIVFLLVIFVRGLMVTNHLSLTADEGIVLSSGYAYLKTHDFEMGLSHPPFIMMLSAIPYLFTGPSLYLDPGWQDLDIWTYGRLFLFGSGNDAQSLIALGRVPMILLSMLLAIFVFHWSKKLFGIKAAVLALALYTFEPNITALSSHAGNDLGVTAFIFIAFFFFWYAWKKQDVKTWIMSGTFTAFALASKHTALLLIPIFIIFAGINYKDKKIKSVIKNLTIFVISILIVINCIYFFQGTFTPFWEQEYRSSIMQPLNSPILEWIPAPLPYYYLEKVDQAVGLSGIEREESEVYVLGERRLGAWYYFLLAFLIKTPVPFLILLFAAIYLSLCEKTALDKKSLLLFLLVPAITLLFFTLGQYKIGLRHLLPAYPFLILAASSLMTYRGKISKTIKYAFIIIILLYVVSSIAIHPHYFSYFNILIGGPDNGHKYLVDSNIDWGQDLKDLKTWMDENGASRIYLSYFGHDNPQYRGINSATLPCNETRGLGYVAVSVNHLYGYIFTGQPKDCYYWLQKYEPIDKAGYSIFIYKIP